MINFTKIARILMPVQQMPQGAVPFYDRKPEDICYDADHEGYLGAKSRCSNDNCVTESVMEE